MPAAESFPSRATACGRQKSVTLPEERRRFAALLRPLSWLPKKPESLQDEKVGKKGAQKGSQGAEGTPMAATRSRTPMPQDFTMCDASRIWCETVWRFGSAFSFFFNIFFFLILHWLAFCLFHFFFLWVVPPENVNLPQKMCTYKHTLLWCAVPIYYPYAPCMRIFSSVHTYHGVLVLGRVCANWPRVSG